MSGALGQMHIAQLGERRGVSQVPDLSLFTNLLAHLMTLYSSLWGLFR